VHRAADRVSESLVERDGRGIVTEHVKKRLFTAIEYRLGDEGDEIVCIAVTAMFGIGATALISVNPSIFMRSPVMAMSRPSTRIPR
jgi:hypothetical protein